MTEQNQMLKIRVEQLEHEMEIVSWYTKVMEDGLDTKEIVKEYYALKEEHSQLKESTDKTISKLQAKNK